MSMSKDRVRFIIPAGPSEQTLTAARKAFGVVIPKVYASDTAIICRPSQFARFLIYRNEEGGKNGFKELRAELFTPTPEPAEIDVSKNPHLT